MSEQRFSVETDETSPRTLERRLGENPVAVVGLGSLFPKSESTAEFWTNILSGADCIEDVPESRWSTAAYYDPDPAAPDKTYCKRGGFIPDVPFNPLEFGVPPGDLEVTDVIQLLSLMVAKQTLADAGCFDAGWYDTSRTGVALGITGANSLIQPLSARLQAPVIREVVRSCGLTERDAEQIADKYVKAFAPWQENSFPGLLGNVVAGRIANRFDLGGINFTADAACASSLVAVRMAVHELLAGKSDLMITGGCDAENTILTYLCFSKTPAFSKSGVIRPFDEDGDGTLIGEGIGMIALKRLADAEQDENRIYALLRGIGASSDGRFKSIYAPRAEGQVVALHRAYADAGFGADQVALIECHGTGTAVGERTELTALNEVFGATATDAKSVAVGSVKSQIGHTKGAAGAASMIKLALSLHQKVFPPTINVDKPHPALRENDSPFYVNTAPRPWIADPKRPTRRAGVSSFGFGGTNFHCVLEEYAGADEHEVLHRTSQVHVWHAPSPTELITTLAEGATGELDASPPPGHAVAAVVAEDDEELERLREQVLIRLRAEPDLAVLELPQGAYYRSRTSVEGKVAALFAGQGSQYVGMGAQAALAVPAVRAAFDNASLQCEDGRPLGLVVFPPPAFGKGEKAEQEAALQATEYAQPGIGALSAGQYRYLEEFGFVPDGALGHSFGELTALWAAGSLGGAEFHRLARDRGLAMASRPEGLPDAGAMASVRADLVTVQRLLVGHPDVAVCNDNAPDQIVVGGGTGAVSAFIAASGEAGVEARQLPVAAAFHTRYVAHAVGAFAKSVREIRVGAPRFPVYADTEGASYGDDVEVNGATLVRQMAHAVSFAPRLEQMYAEGFRVFVEFGPRSVLGGLVRRTLGDRHDIVVLSADAGPNGNSDRALKQLVARLVVLGLPLSGVNRPTAQVKAEKPANAMTIMLNGVNHVPEERRREYRDALENGYRVDATAPQPQRAEGAPVAEQRLPAVREAEPFAVAPHEASTPAPVSGLAAEHLGMHREYLGHQLQVADRISALIQREAEQQHGLRDGVIDGIRAIAEHSVAIGHSHAQASEVLQSFAHLAAGALPASPLSHPVEFDRRPVPAPSLEPNPPPVPAPIEYGATALAPAAPQPAPVASVDSAVLAPVSAPVVSAGVGVDAVCAALLEVVSSRTGYPGDMLELGMDIEADLGIDSIKRVEIMGALRERFPSAQAAPEQLAQLRTLQQIIDFVADVSPGTAAPTGEDVHSGPKAEGDPGIVRRFARLRSLPLADRLENAYRAYPVALLTGDGDLRPAVADALAAAGWSVLDDPEPPVDLDRLDLVLFLPGELAEGDGPVPALRSALLLAGRTQSLLERAAEVGDRAAFVTVTRLDGALGLTGGATTDTAVLGGLGGLVKTLAVEAPALFVRAVDLDPTLGVSDSVRLLLDELHDPDTAVTEVGRASDGSRRTLGLADDSLPGDGLPPAGEPVVPGAHDLLVITGGGRGVTAACAVALAREHQPAMLLLGRSELAPEPDWARGVPGGGLRAAIAARLKAEGTKPTPRDVERIARGLTSGREIDATLTAIRAAGAEAEYLAVDVTDADAVRTALAPYRERITGIVHGAGVIADELIVGKRAEDIDRILGTKLDGLAAVLAAVERNRLRHLLLFSSVAGFFGNRGQSDYAMANEALNRIACVIKRAQPDVRATSLNWGAWAGGMVTPELEQMFGKRGIPLVPVELGAAMFVEQFTQERGNDVIAVLGPKTALSAREPRALPDVGLRMSRDLAAVAGDPVVTDHVIGGVPVLPATAVVGALLNVAAQVHPGRHAAAVRNFAVFKGVSFDAEAEQRLTFGLAPNAATVAVTVQDARGRPRYRGEVVLADRAPEPAGSEIVVPSLDGGSEVDVYGDGTLFHGPALRGIRRLVAEDEDGLALGCELPDAIVAGGAYAVAGFSPIIADVLLQAGVLWVSRHQGLSSLPSSIGELRVHGTPKGRFGIVVRGMHRTQSSFSFDVSAHDGDTGDVLLALRDVEVVASAALNEKFKAGTR